MGAYIVKRFLLGIFTIWVVSVLAFVIIQLPEGDWLDEYEELLHGFDIHLSLGEKEDLRDYFGLNDPMIVRYGKWAWNVLHYDFGYTYLKGGFEYPVLTPVRETIEERFILTVVLSFFTMAVTWVFAIPVGIYSAVRQHSVGDYFFTFVGFTGIAIPDFLLGLVLMYIAFAYLDQTVGGLFSDKYMGAQWNLDKIWDLIKHLWIPAVVLGTSGTASLIRIMRNNLLDELGRPYVMTARSKGMSNWRLILKYPVRVASNPLVSTVGYLLPALINGSIIVSVVLSLPTLGPVLLGAILQQDVFVAGAIILMLGVLTVVGTFLSDMLLMIVDPRIKFTSKQ